jgi:hypothetical protein
MRDLMQAKFLLRLDGVAVALVALLLYRELGVSWWVFAACFLAPDLAFIAYVFGPRAGAATYNALHTYVVGALMFGAGLLTEHTALMAVGLIWVGHIGIDRAFGFGLKYRDDFRRTHLQRL